jgi:FkbH-like protein
VISKRTIDLDYRRLVRASKQLVPGRVGEHLRIAIISDAATQQFVPLLRTLFHENGVNVEVYEGAFDAFELEVYNEASGLYELRPNVVVLATCTQALRTRYYLSGGHDFLKAAGERITRLWDALQNHCRARIVQFNFPMPYERQFGHFDWKVPESLYAGVAALNGYLAAQAREHRNVLICDVEAISSWFGRQNWYDDRLWNMAKAFCNLEYLPQVAQALVEIVLSTMGRIVKCVVLDLDNTLWGGVVGDDGPLGIVVGAHGDGEPFHHFQHYLLSLKKRGILLAVCSKNDYANAIRPFMENPDMVLKREDITVFIANWENKADNIRAIRDTLEIGLDSILFLDDNPFERNLVRELAPEVIVPEMPPDPADYVRVISSLNLFETSSFSNEDLARSALYKEEAERREQRSQFSNIDDYLKSLDMQIEVQRFDQTRIARISQLIQRSNQFNLTTHRYNEAECEAMMRDEASAIPLWASLSDRYGDHGLISIVILRLHPGEIEITDWLMSCRVLARGVEHFLMTRVVDLARQNAAKLIRGEYIPTAKNAMVKEFYAQFGFQMVSEKDGRSQWHLDPAAYRAREIFIREKASS